MVTYRPWIIRVTDPANKKVQEFDRVTASTCMRSADGGCCAISLSALFLKVAGSDEARKT